MRRHTEGNNLCLLTVPLDFNGRVALMAIDNKQAVAAHNPPLCLLIKVLQPLQAKLICCPAVLRDCNNPVLGQALLVPGREVVPALKVNKGWNSLTHRVNARITVLHSRLPCWTDFGRPRCSEAVTTAPVDIWPIMKPVSAKLYISLS